MTRAKFENVAEGTDRLRTSVSERTFRFLKAPRNPVGRERGREECDLGTAKTNNDLVAEQDLDIGFYLIHAKRKISTVHELSGSCTSCFASSDTGPLASSGKLCELQLSQPVRTGLRSEINVKGELRKAEILKSKRTTK